MKKSLKAFTLVEMLIVMGIIVILMAVGIASGRAALRNANKIEHQNAAEQIYQALQGYYADNREYPDIATSADLETMLTTGGALDEYIDEFDGGSAASYAYVVDNTAQEFLVCTTMGGAQDEGHLGVYCTGNGIGASSLLAGPAKKFADYVDPEAGDYATMIAYIRGTAPSGGTVAVSEWTSDGTW